MTRVSRPDRGRQHTLLFLQLARQQSPILLDTDIDMSNVVAHRERRRDSGQAVSYVSFVVSAAARALARHPEANAAMRGTVFPRLARYGQVTAKVAFDKELGGVRAVVSGLIPDADHLPIDEIDSRIRYFRDREVADIPELAGVRLLDRLPW